MKKYLVCFLAMGLLLVNCNNDDDAFIEPSGPDPEPDSQVDVAAQDFIWKALNLWYFWQQDVPNLADDKFTTSAEYTEFLASESDPGVFFDDKLRFNEDRFTFYDSDYRALTESLGGISPNNGLEFGLSLFRGSEDVFGYVYYILPGSDASTKDIKRGDIFTGVDGQTLNLGNYRELLYGENTSYTLNMASLENDSVTPNGKEVALTKQAGFQENPLFLDTIIETNGKKIGYLVYNRFLGAFDQELNEVIGRFGDAGITDLVLDLRYNPGGSVLSSMRLASMIYDDNTQNVFSQSIYNDKYSAFLNSQNADVNNYFQDRVILRDEDNNVISDTKLNTLNLNKVHIISLYSSASASELVINGLEPYMDVIHVGDTTRGKNEFSRTLVDDPANNYLYSNTRISNIDPDNSWAIQPLIGRSANADGFFQYTNGLNPDIIYEEKLSNYGVLGDPNEPLLARAIQSITGESSKRAFDDDSFPVNDFSNSRLNTVMKDNMHVNDLKSPLTAKE